jgi:hypothetical protein
MSGSAVPSKFALHRVGGKREGRFVEWAHRLDKLDLSKDITSPADSFLCAIATNSCPTNELMKRGLHLH